MEYTQEQKRKYLNDLDNLIITGWFPNDSIEECTFHHRHMTLKEFVSKGRSIISTSLKE